MAGRGRVNVDNMRGFLVTLRAHCGVGLSWFVSYLRAGLSHYEGARPCMTIDKDVV